ncbi:hypothetical protein WP50_35370 [Lactiplantibacillus plantarum]|nr:hypothetical protein WP50_35370 [Lactiplantibacillus plantarum]
MVERAVESEAILKRQVGVLKQQRVDRVIEQVKERAQQTDDLLAKAHHETDVIQKNYGDNNSVNTFEVDDRIETNAELQQQKQMVERAVESEAILKRQVGVLKQQRVDRVIEQVKERAQQTDDLLAKAHHETDVIQKNYGDNNSVNTFEVDDRIETNAELQQQKQMVERAVESEAILKRQVGVLKDLSNSPYFGRIDIQDSPDEETERLYIGTASFVDAEQNFLVYDWRAPISSVYYNGTLGQVQYQTPAGQQTTELIKKRQFQINHGQIKNMFDTNETVGDEILQAVLGEQNDAYMQNIVATIQKRLKSMTGLKRTRNCNNKSKWLNAPWNPKPS